MKKLLGEDAAKAVRNQTNTKLQSMKEALINNVLRDSSFVSSLKKRMASNGCKCPYPDCEGSLIEGDFVEIDGNNANQKCHCLTCNRFWTDTYIINSIELHDPPLDPHELKEPDDGD